MGEFLSMVRSIGVPFGATLEQYRDPWLVSCALVLIFVALGYLISPSVRLTIENTLSMKRPTGFKRLFGGLLILLPGMFILAATYFAQLTHVVEQRWPGLARQYISTNKTQNRELVAHTTTTSEARNRTPVESVGAQESTQNIDTTAVESVGTQEPTPNMTWPSLGPNSDPELELKQKQAARRKLIERRLREQERRRKRNVNIWLTKGGEVAAVSESLLDVAVSHLASKNMEAFHRLEAEQRVLFLKEGERVSIVRYEYTSGKVQIRLLNSNMELWTFRKSLTKG